MGEGVQYSRLLSFSWPYSVTDCWVDRLPAVLPQWQRHQLGVIIILLSKAQGGCTEVILLHSLSALTLPRAITDAMPRTPRGCVTLYVCLWGDGTINGFSGGICLRVWHAENTFYIGWVGVGGEKNYSIHLFLHSLNQLGHVCCPRPSQGTHIHTSSASHNLQRLA